MTASVEISTPIRQPWPAAAATAVGGTLILLGLFWETTWSAVETWNTDFYGHGYLIVPIVGYLIWRQRTALGDTAPRTNVWGLALVAAAAVIWLIGEAAGVQLVKQFALVAMIQSMVLATLGTRATRIIAYPLLYLFFCVPFGGFLIAPLQEFTAQFTVRALQITGIPVFLDGWLIDIPIGRFHVAEACSGTRFLISSAALGFLVAHLFYRQIWRRVLFIAIALAVPIFANGVRAYGIVIIAHLTNDMESAAGADHVIYGLVFLSIVIFCVLAIGTTFRERERDGLLAPPLAARATSGSGRSGLVALVLVAAAAIGVAAGARAYANAIGSDATRILAIAVPPTVVAPPWQPTADAMGSWKPEFPTTDATASVTFSHGADTVSLIVAYVAAQRQGTEIVSDRHQLAGTGWTEIGHGTRDVTIGGAPLSVRTTRIKRGEGGRVMWYWYWVADRYVTGSIEAKLLEVRAKILGGTQAAALIVVSSTYGETPSEATAALERFAASLGPLESALGRIADRDEAAAASDGRTGD